MHAGIRGTFGVAAWRRPHRGEPGKGCASPHRIFLFYTMKAAHSGAVLGTVLNAKTNMMSVNDRNLFIPQKLWLKHT
jgi:hypothetical protein